MTTPLNINFHKWFFLLAILLDFSQIEEIYTFEEKVTLPLTNLNNLTIFFLENIKIDLN